MSDTVTRLTEALDDLRAELAHADALITQQQTRIEKLERHISYLRPKSRPAWRVRDGSERKVSRRRRLGRSADRRWRQRLS
jgi:hypothetical protein